MYLAIEDDHILIIPAVTSNDVSVPCGVVLFCNSIIARCRYVRSVWLSVEYETIHHPHSIVKCLIALNKIQRELIKSQKQTTWKPPIDLYIYLCPIYLETLRCYV